MEMIVVKSKIKEVAGNFNVAGDFADALNQIASQIIEKASKRAEANGRKTIQARDVYLGEINSKVMLVVKSKMKSLVTDFNISSDFADALNQVLVWNVQQAALRAEANGRKTIQARDL